MNEFSNILFLDIETVSNASSYDLLSDREKKHWLRKTRYLRQGDENKSSEELYSESAGIYAEFGKIIVIAVGMILVNEKGEPWIKVKYLANHDEKILLQEFISLLNKFNNITLKLCAHNGKEFDFPYLCRRMIINGIPLPDVLNYSGKKPWEVPFVDTMELWKFGDYKHYTALDLLATLFDIPSSKISMDGSEVSSVYYEDKNLQKIAEYCVEDVIVLIQVFLKLKMVPIIKPENIVRT